MSDPIIEQEQRRFSRLQFDANIILSNGRQNWTSKLIDISLKGALIEQPTGWDGQLSEAYQLQIRLNGGETVITMHTTVAHKANQNIGLQCTHIDVDSISQLRRLIELNLGDDALLQRELSAMVQ